MEESTAESHHSQSARLPNSLPGSSSNNQAKLKQSVTFNLPPYYDSDQEISSTNAAPTSCLWPTTSGGTPSNIDGRDDDDINEENRKPALRRLASTTSWRSRVQNKTEELRKLFSLPPTEHLINDYMCALRKKILLQGRLYVFSSKLCFYCSLFGYTKIKVIKIADIDMLAKKKNVGFPNSISISLKDGRREFFTSFISREDAYTLIESLWMEEQGLTCPAATSGTPSSLPSPATDGNKKESTSPRSPRSPISPTAVASSVATKLIKGLSSVGRSSSSKKTSSTSSHERKYTTKGTRAQSTTATAMNDDIDFPTSSSDSIPLQLHPSYGFLESNFNDASIMTSSSEEDSDHGGDEDVVAGGLAEFIDISDQQCKAEFKEIAHDDSRGPGLHGCLSTPAPSPHPEAVLTLKKRLHSCTPEMYWCLVLSNSSAAFFSQFHERRGDKQVKISPWQRHEQVGMVRDVSFVYEVKSRIGPPVTLCHQSQRYQMHQGHHLVFETTQVMPDIPYGDHFQVLARWDITPYDDDVEENSNSNGDTDGNNNNNNDNDDDDSPTGSGSSSNGVTSEGVFGSRKTGGCNVEVRLRIPFGKGTLWKKFIEKSVLESATESADIFISLVEEKLAEKRGKICVGRERQGGGEGSNQYLEKRSGGDVMSHSTTQVLPSLSQKEEEGTNTTGSKKGNLLPSYTSQDIDDDEKEWDRMLMVCPPDVKLRVQRLRDALRNMKQQNQDGPNQQQQQQQHSHNADIAKVSKWWKVIAVLSIVVALLLLLALFVLMGTGAGNGTDDVVVAVGNKTIPTSECRVVGTFLKNLGNAKRRLSALSK
jgi:hypothetical protein